MQSKMNPSSAIFVAGHRGLVGSAIVRALQKKGFHNLILKTRKELNLVDQAATFDFFKKNKIDYAFIAAAKVGGIHANSTYQADFLYENIMIAANVVKGAADNGVEKLLFLGSSCIYPKFAPQPIPEEALLSSPLEESNEGYALAKISGLKLCEMFQRQYKKRFISAMPCNLYGVADNFHPENSHVIPGMMRRFHNAKQSKSPTITIWGSGKPRREFLYSDDLAEALLLLMDEYEESKTINVGAGDDLTIAELAHLVAQATGYQGDIVFDTSKPDGTPRKLMDISKIRKLGWNPSTRLQDGLKVAYQWALDNKVFET